MSVTPPIIMWKCPTTKYVSVSCMSAVALPRYSPPSPPLPNNASTPQVNIMGTRMPIDAPHRLASMLTPKMVIGSVMVSVAIERYSPVNGLMPLTNMWWPQTIMLSAPTATRHQTEVR